MVQEESKPKAKAPTAYSKGFDEMGARYLARDSAKKVSPMKPLDSHDGASKGDKSLEPTCKDSSTIPTKETVPAKESLPSAQEAPTAKETVATKETIRAEETVPAAKESVPTKEVVLAEEAVTAHETVSTKDQSCNEEINTISDQDLESKTAVKDLQVGTPKATSGNASSRPCFCHPNTSPSKKLNDLWNITPFQFSLSIVR